MNQKLMLTSAILTLALNSGCNPETIEKVVPAVTSSNIDSQSGPAPSSFTSEANLTADFSAKILPFYNSGQGGFFGNPKIAYRIYKNPIATAGIVISPGRTESIVKYSEVAYDLYQQGYSVYVISHRGQGESDHLVGNDPNNHSSFDIGHIDNYRDYAKDLEEFVQMVSSSQPLFLLAHSMGGPIAAIHEGLFPGRFKAIVLSSPMFTINTAPFGDTVADMIINTACGAGNQKSFGKNQAVYKENPTFNPIDSNNDNQVTHSEARFNLKVKLFTDYPRTKLGGVSNGWLCQWINAGTRLAQNPVGDGKSYHANKTPTLLFQSGKDLIVEPAGQNYYCGHAQSCTLMQYPTAYHEILQETDDIRNLAMSRIVKWFKYYETH